MRKSRFFPVMALLAITFLGLGFIGCGGDDTETDTTTKPTTQTPPDDGEIASNPIDYDAEKAALQKLWSDFVTGFNTFELKNVEDLWSSDTQARLYFIIGDKEQSGFEGGSNVINGMRALWNGIGTAGTRWAGTSLHTFYIRRTEASAIGSTAYESAGQSYIYFKKVRGEWLISQVDSINSGNMAFRKGSVLIPKFFDDEEDKAP